VAQGHLDVLHQDQGRWNGSILSVSEPWCGNNVARSCFCHHLGVVYQPRLCRTQIDTRQLAVAVVTAILADGRFLVVAKSIGRGDKSKTDKKVHPARIVFWLEPDHVCCGDSVEFPRQNIVGRENDKTD